MEIADDWLGKMLRSNEIEAALVVSKAVDIFTSIINLNNIGLRWGVY